MFHILLQIFKQPINQSKLSNRRSLHTVCMRSSHPFYIVTYYNNWAKTSWAYINLYISLESDYL